MDRLSAIIYGCVGEIIPNLNIRVAFLILKNNISQCRQNKPSRIVDELEEWGVPRPSGYMILFATGVCKWLTVRRKLIKLKNAWREDITELTEEIREAKKGNDVALLYRLRGRLEMLQQCRAQVRALCHSKRWALPDYDTRAIREVNEIMGEEQ